MRHWGWLSLVVAFLLVAPARADHEETERRLKAAGVDAELRKRIHTAIDRAVDYLAERQRRGGSWTQRPLMAGIIEAQTVSGFTSLAGLACAHADTPKGVRAAERAIDYLLPGDHTIKSGVYRHVYTAGLSAMLLQARRRDREVGHEIGKRLAAGIGGKTGWWGYVTYGPPIPPGNPVGANLSTSQFAVLGLWAAERMDAVIDRKVWRKHLLSLCMTQLDDGSWSYWPGRGNARGYRTGTYMGLANLILARAALGDTLDDEPRLRKRADVALDRALQALDRDGPETLSDFRNDSAFGWAGHYEIYALEKACIFANQVRVGGRHWYADAAEVLVDSQLANGGWGTSSRARAIGGRGGGVTSDLYRTAFGLLFLLRTSEVYRPVTPSSIRRPVKTGPGDEGPPAAAGGTPRSEVADHAAGDRAPADPTPIGTARGLLDELERQLADRSVANVILLDTLGEAAAAYATLAPDRVPEGAGGDALMAAESEFLKLEPHWRTRAEGLFVRAAVLRDVDKRAKVNRREQVNIAAARTLARTRPRVADAFRRAVEKHLLQPRGYLASPELYAAAFRTLGRLDHADSFEWLAKSVVRTERRPEAVKKTLAALEALTYFRDVPGKRRRHVARHLVNLFHGIENYVLYDDPNRFQVREFWERIRRSVIDALRAVCRDAATGKRPLDPLGHWIGSVRDFRVYLRRHDDARRPPWR